MSEPKLWVHQEQCVAKLAPRSDGALLMEVGTGKTPAMVHILRHKYNEHKAILPTLILCPPIVIANWHKHLLRFSKIPAERIYMLTGPGSRRLHTLTNARSKWDDFCIAITNYEALLMEPLLAEFQEWLVGGVVVADEVHRIKNGAAKRTKRALTLADVCKYRYIMTGTPVLNTPMDIFWQYRFMDQGRTFGKNFFAFRSMYFWDRNAGMARQKYFPDWQPRSDAKERIGRMIEASSFQAKKHECLTLPPLIKERIDVALSPEQGRAYEEMKQQFITFVHNEACVAELAITKTLRLQQILAGFIRTTDGGDIPFKETPRIKAVKELLEDIIPSEKVLIWCNFIEAYKLLEQACKDVGAKYVMLTGQQTRTQKDTAVREFETDDSVRVLIGNPRAGGIGIDLIAASTMIYYTRSFSKEDRDQSEARNYRGGSERHKKITLYDIVAPGTIDEVVLESLTNKTNIAEAILAWARGETSD